MTPNPAPAENPDRDHVWIRTQIGWQIAFWSILVGAVIVLVGADVTGPRRWLGFTAIAGLGLGYAVLRPDPTDNSAPRDISYLTIVIVCCGLAVAAEPNLSLLLFIAYTHVNMFASSRQQALTFAVALTVSCLIGFLSASGWSTDEFWVIVPTMGASLIFTVLLGAWTSRIIDQSRERAQLIEQLETTRSELGEAHHAQGVMAERERMAREIHDTLAQGFTSIIMLAQATRAEIEAQSAQLPPGNDCQPAMDRLDSIEVVARENLGEARALVTAFSPFALEGATLTDAVRRLAQRFGVETGVAIDVEVSAPSGDLVGLSRDREVVLLRTAQEALNNVRRHAQARLVTVRLATQGAQASVEIEDDGIGFGPQTPAGFGLIGMRDRARDAGGELEITSAPGAGTRVSVRLPVSAGGPLPAADPTPAADLIPAADPAPGAGSIPAADPPPPDRAPAADSVSAADRVPL
jgi:signal transduction histidine kinase